MATVKITYTIHNVPPGKCVSVFTADGVDPVRSEIDVPASAPLPVVVDTPEIVVSS